MEKLYDRIDFYNNESPALSASNLNNISTALDKIDTRLANIYITQTDVNEVQANTELSRQYRDSAKQYRDEAFETTPSGYEQVTAQVTTNKNDLTYVKSALTNFNLIDNGWFTVNQRGASSYSGNGIYTVDRWKSVLGNYTVSSNGFTFKYVANTDNVLDQKLSTPLTQGETYTLSVKIGGVVYSKTFVANDSGDYERIGNSTIFAHMGVIKETLRLYDYRLNRDTTIQAIKLEYGSTSTLANDHAPNYADELSRCQMSVADSSDNFANQTHNFVTITGYTASTGTNVIVRYPYPTGFNVNNTMIAGFIWQTLDDGLWISSEENGSVIPELRQESLAVYSSGAEGTKSRPFKFTIMRI